MKKILYGMMAATMIFATSCENELEVGAAGEESMVSFTIATPDMGSRAYSDGTTATQLQYAVYDANGTYLSGLTGSKEFTLSTTVNLKLTTGNTYSVIFWAAAPNAPYTVDFANKKMTVNYTNAVSNDEKRDAFYKYHTFTVNGAQTEAIELKRPFAQLNIGTKDYAASASAGYTPTHSAVTVKNVYSTLDLVEGEVSGGAEVTFDYNAIDKEETFPVADCEYIAMNYLLVGADKETVEVEFTYTDGSNAKTRTVGSVPVQRNYRTNIYGQLLTSEVDINVEIKPEYDGAHVAEALFLAAATGGEVTLTEDVVLTTPLEVQANMVLNLANNKLTGSINVANDVELTVNNGAIENTNKENSGIESTGKLTLNNVEITSARHAVRIEDGEAVINGGTYKVAPAAGTKMTVHALNVSGDSKVTIKGGTFIGAKGTNADSGSAVNVQSGASVTIEGGDFSGGKNKTLACGGTLIVKGGSFDQNPANYIAEGYKTVKNGEKWFVVAESTEAVATTAAEITSAIENGATEIVLAAGEYVLPSSAKGKTITFVGSANAEDVKVAVTKVGAGGENCDYALDGSTVTFENITITTNSSTYIGYARCNGTYKNCIINGTYTLYGNSVFENCTFNVSGDKYNIWTWGAPEATFTDCTFNCDGKSLLLYGQANTKLTVNNCTFNDNGTISGKAAIEIGNDYNKSYELIVNNTTVNGFDINPNGFVTGTTLWANKNSMPADKLKVTVDGKDAYTIVVYTVEKLNEMLNNDKVTVIELGEGNFGTIVAKSNKTIIGSAEAKVDCVNLNGAQNLTLKNINFDAATAKMGYDKHKSGTARQVANIITGDNENNPNIGARNLVIDGCTFTGTFANGGAAIAFTDRSRPTGASGNVTIKNCTFNTVGAYYDIYGYYTGAGQNGYGNFAIENNKFKSETQGKTIYLGQYASNIAVEVNGNVFETKDSINDALYLQAASNYTVQYNASGNTFAQ